MDKAKLQVEAFKALVVHRAFVAYECNDGDAYITFDGYSAFLVPAEDVCIDVLKMRHMPSLKNLFELSKGYCEARLTKRCAMFNANGGILREYRAVDDAAKHVWVRESMMKRYNSEKYTAYIRDELGAVKFVNQATGKVDHIVLPVRVCNGGNDD